MKDGHKMFYKLPFMKFVEEQRKENPDINTDEIVDMWEIKCFIGYCKRFLDATSKRSIHRPDNS